MHGPDWAAPSVLAASANASAPNPAKPAYRAAPKARAVDHPRAAVPAIAPIGTSGDASANRKAKAAVAVVTAVPIVTAIVVIVVVSSGSIAHIAIAAWSHSSSRI